MTPDDRSPVPGADLSRHGLPAVVQAVESALSAFLMDQRVRMVGLAVPSGHLVDLVAEATAAGGKRLRPALCYAAYRVCGGPEGPEILRAAASLELLHTSAILHDDVMDQAALRRGAPSLHRRIAAQRSAAGGGDDAGVFGVSVAILAGDLAWVLSDALLASSGFDAATLSRAAPALDRMRAQAIAGQYLDLFRAGPMSPDSTSAIAGVPGSTSAGVPGSTSAGVPGSTSAGVRGSTAGAGVPGFTSAGVPGFTSAGVRGSTAGAGVPGFTSAGVRGSTSAGVPGSTAGAGVPGGVLGSRMGSCLPGDVPSERRTPVDVAVEDAAVIGRLKAAGYSVEGPVAVGCALAGAPDELCHALNCYSTDLGEAFYLCDELLGVFGDPAETGKDAESDLRRGKPIRLIASALVLGNPSERAAIQQRWGKPDATSADLAAVRSAVRSSGALAAAVADIDAYVESCLAWLRSAGVMHHPASALLVALAERVRSSHLPGITG